MVHLKITCDECQHDDHFDCKGILFFIVDPKDKTTPGVLTGMHHLAPHEVIGSVLKWLGEALFEEFKKGAFAGNAERLLGQIKDIDEMLKGL